jgi:hypothetical protein
MLGDDFVDLNLEETDSTIKSQRNPLNEWSLCTKNDKECIILMDG